MTTRSRQLDRERDADELASTSLAPTLAPERPSAIERLQRGAGNAAVSRMLARRPAKPAGRASGAQLMRYDAFEHAGAGDKAPGSQKVTIAGETLTSGEINALADLYGSPEALMKADPTELKKLLVLVRRQVAGGKVEESEWDKTTGGRYNELNLKNSPHFAPHAGAAAPKPGASADGAGDHLARFLAYYEAAATNYVVAAGNADPAAAKQARDTAIVNAGFAEHYLMDAFSAGHLFNKDDFMARFRQHVEALSPDRLTKLFEGISADVLADKKCSDLLGKYETADTKYGIHWNLDGSMVFPEVLARLYADKKKGNPAVYSGLVKVVHDRLSEHQGANGVGVEVANKNETWTLSGDRTLGYSPDTQRIINQALTTFRGLMQGLASATASPANLLEGASQVTELFPHPTPATAKLMDQMIDEATDAGKGTRAALVEALKGELPSIIAALLDDKWIRPA